MLMMSLRHFVFQNFFFMERRVLITFDGSPISLIRIIRLRFSKSQSVVITGQRDFCRYYGIDTLDYLEHTSTVSTF